MGDALVLLGRAFPPVQVTVGDGGDAVVRAECCGP